MEKEKRVPSDWPVKTAEGAFPCENRSPQGRAKQRRLRESSRTLKGCRGGGEAERDECADWLLELEASQYLGAGLYE
jgi:hypothetical protein